MALCPHCWESLVEPVPALCPTCGKPQPLHLAIPDSPTDELLAWPADDATPTEETTSPTAGAWESPPIPAAPPEDWADRVTPPQQDSAPHRSRGVLGLFTLIGSIVVLGGLAAIPFDVAARDVTGQVTGTGAALEEQLAVGDCYGPDLELGEAYGGAVTATPCTEPHLWEVVGKLNHPDEQYPGEGVMEQWTIELCRRAFEQYVGAESGRAVDVEMWYRFPRQDSWDAGSRTAWCLATRGQASTGSVRRPR